MPPEQETKSPESRPPREGRGEGRPGGGREGREGRGGPGGGPHRGGEGRRRDDRRPGGGGDRGDRDPLRPARDRARKTDLRQPVSRQPGARRRQPHARHGFRHQEPAAASLQRRPPRLPRRRKASASTNSSCCAPASPTPSPVTGCAASTRSKSCCSRSPARTSARLRTVQGPVRSHRRLQRVRRKHERSHH